MVSLAFRLLLNSHAQELPLHREEPNQILIHIRMLDDTAQLQQEAVGALGVNLIHGALTCNGNPNKVIGGLLDDLNRWRLTVRTDLFSASDASTMD